MSAAPAVNPPKKDIIVKPPAKVLLDLQNAPRLREARFNTNVIVEAARASLHKGLPGSTMKMNNSWNNLAPERKQQVCYMHPETGNLYLFGPVPDATGSMKQACIAVIYHSAVTYIAFEDDSVEFVLP